MSIYKVLVSCTKKVPMVHSPSGYSYTDEQHAYAEYQYFSTLAKAQAYCQQYTHTIFEWEQLGNDCWSCTFENVSFSIFWEKDAEFDTPVMFALPTKFATRHHLGD